MMKTLKITSAILMAFSAASLSAATFYSDAKQSNPHSGKAWNTQADGLGTAGFSTTYTNAENDIIIQAEHIIDVPKSMDTTWSAKSYTLKGTFRALDEKTSTFTTDINAANGAAWTVGNNHAIVAGTANFIIGANTVAFTNSSSKSAGALEFGLNIVGSGMIDFKYANSAMQGFHFRNITSDFTGTFNAGRSNDIILRFTSGEGTKKSKLILGRGEGDKVSKLYLDGDVYFQSVKIDGKKIPKGSYTYQDLIALSDGYANNLLDNGGTLHVAIP